MTQEQLQQRAVAFARRVTDLNRFLVSDKVTKELYGYTRFVLHERKLRDYYEHHEPNAAWRDWSSFRAEVEHLVEMKKPASSASLGV